jgi:hypothetical protein
MELFSLVTDEDSATRLSLQGCSKSQNGIKVCIVGQWIWWLPQMFKVTGWTLAGVHSC